MNIKLKILKILLHLSIGIFIIYREVEESDSWDILSAIITYGLGGLFIGIFFLYTVIDQKEYKQTKSKWSLSPTIIGVLIIISFAVTEYMLHRRDASPVVLQISNDGGFNACGFEFRKDGTYKFFNGSGLGVSYVRGNYTLYGSLIRLDTSKIDNVITSNRLVIRQREKNILTVVQVDSNNKINNKDFEFDVNTDNRTK